jgi:hypothetical protein
VGSESKFPDVIDPGTEQVIGQLPHASKADPDRALAVGRPTVFVEASDEAEVMRNDPRSAQRAERRHQRALGRHGTDPLFSTG